MRILLVACLALMCGSAQAVAAPMNRDDQWIYREHTGDGGGQPSATFLSWDYSAVLFNARCDRSTQTVTLTYQADPGVDMRKAWDRRPLTVVLGKSRVIFATVISEEGSLAAPSVLKGTSKVTPKVLAAFAQSAEDEVSIEAPEEEYGEWFVGKAEPLRRLFRACA